LSDKLQPAQIEHEYLTSWKLSNADQNMSVKSFSGAIVDDKPTISNHPDKLVIHAGTNDVCSLSPTNIADKVTDLTKQFKRESNHTKVIIPSLVTRKDNQELARKVKRLTLF
jgi:hypothetical protein